MIKVEGNELTLATGKIEIHRIRKVAYTAQYVILSLTPTDEFFTRAFGRRPTKSERMELQVSCSPEDAARIIKAVGLPVSED